MEILRIIVDAVCVLQDAQRGSVRLYSTERAIAARHEMAHENRKIKKPPTAVTIKGS